MRYELSDDEWAAINPQKLLAADANTLIFFPLTDHNRTCPDLLVDRLGRE
jgi:hypothetical protein